jgi:hypothetical protein
MSPMPSVSPAPASPFRMSPQQEMYQSPMQTHAPIPSIPVSSPPPPIPPPSTAPPPMTALPSRSSDGPQIRLNPLVMKPNLSRSLPVTTPFKKCVPHTPIFRSVHDMTYAMPNLSVITDVSIVRPTIRPISRILTLSLFTGNLVLMIDDKHATRTRYGFFFLLVHLIAFFASNSRFSAWGL